MSFFNANITGSGGGGANGLVTKFEKTVAISSTELAEVVVSLADDISNYANITNEQIIVELKGTSAIAAGDATLAHSYNAETGELTVTSNNSKIPFASSSAVELELNVFVAGAVQIPPAPDSSVYKIGGAGTYYLTHIEGYRNLTVNDFLLVTTSASTSTSGGDGQVGDAAYDYIDTSVSYTSPSVTYNPENGQLVVKNGSCSAIGKLHYSGESQGATVAVTCTCYLVKGGILNIG